VRVPFWLRGGWALDFLLGEVRPDHADVDLVAWLRDGDAIREVLTSRGFELARELPDVAIDFEKQGESIQVLLVERNSAGELVCRGFESWPFPEGALDGPVRSLEGVRASTLSPDALLYEKETYEANRSRPRRAKDDESIRLLRELARNRVEASRG
jgi:Aminoglycoside-2''-adenylyltransferase